MDSRKFDSLLAVLFLAITVACSQDSGGPIVARVPCQPSGLPGEFTVATYNIHAGVGRDGSRNLHRIAETLTGVDVAGLQEVDNGRIRSRFENQVRSIAAALGHRYWQYFPAEDYWPLGTYGVAATTSLPIVAAGGFDLPVVEGKPLRRLGWIRFLVDCRPIHAFIIHATRVDDSMASIQAAQIEEAWRIISEKVTAQEPVILLGDFNARPNSTVIQWLRERMVDVTETQSAQPSANVFIDHIFVKGSLEIMKVAMKDNGASDHPAVVATLRWKENADVQSQ